VLQELRQLFWQRLYKVSPPKTDVPSQFASFEPIYSILADLEDTSMQASHLVCCTSSSSWWIVDYCADQIVTVSQQQAIGALATLTVCFPLGDFNALKAFSRCVADCNPVMCAPESNMLVLVQG
jgi:hypothetical protein